jgi:hypothetical protein
MDVRAYTKRSGGVVATLVLVLAGVALLIGCARDSSETLRGDDSVMLETTTTYVGYAPESPEEGGAGDAYSKSGPATDSLVALQTTPTYPVASPTDRMIVSNASLLIEVDRGQFQVAFDQALLLADKYGGYVVSSNSNASGDEEVMRNGTISLRVPSTSFSQALSDASKLGTVMSRDVDSQDVTEEFLDLEARLKNAQAQERALLDLMGKAETVDEILQVRQYLSQTQMEIEQLKGRMRFLEEHTSYSTLTLSLYEVGTEVVAASQWGFVDALKDALHAFVDSINSMIIFVGGAIPVALILAMFGWVGYRWVRSRTPRGQGDDVHGVVPSPRTAAPEPPATTDGEVGGGVGRTPGGGVSQ